MNNQEMVREFHETFDVVINDEPQLCSRETATLRMKLIEEETKEVVEALYGLDVYHLAKELADLLYVTYGTAVSHGIDLDKVFKAVHDSNMSKLEDGKVLRREDGKVLKGSGYYEPDIESLLENNYD